MHLLIKKSIPVSPRPF